MRRDVSIDTPQLNSSEQLKFKPQSQLLHQFSANEVQQNRNFNALASKYHQQRIMLVYSSEYNLANHDIFESQIIPKKRQQNPATSKIKAELSKQSTQDINPLLKK